MPSPDEGQKERLLRIIRSLWWSADIAQSRPEIGGSFGGFIALVVALASIFIISCVGIFILLRNHEPTSYERRLRRNRAREHDFSTEVPIGPPGIRERLAHLFGRRRGWIKASAGDGDEWDASDDRFPQQERGFSVVREHDLERGVYPASFAAEGRPRAQDSLAPSDSTDSVEVELNAPSALSYPTYSQPPRSLGISYSSDLDDEPTPSIHAAPGSIPVSQSPPSALSPETAAEAEMDMKPRDEKHFSVQSGSSDLFAVRSMRKFDNGTKFKESL
ncbi:hypothetical protein BD413DRAFT_621675 [Trametes elegans]|nr:hypothetical protein BD413DRAFT_621675 [Trametes elegans]